METENSQHCVLLPCSNGEHWAVPHNCLAEIVTLPIGDDDSPPAEITWRGQAVPVLDLGETGDASWRESHGGTGLIAVFLGLEGEGLEYWGLVLRGVGLGTTHLLDDDIEDCETPEGELYSAAFRIGDDTYRVPDLFAVQKHMSRAMTETA